MSDRTLRRAMLVLSVIGFGIASYLVYVHYSGEKPVCSLGGDCQRVQTSQWSKLAGIPVADIGLAGYFGILVALGALRGELQRLALVAMTVIGLAFSGYLTYRELYSIHAICQWCVGSAITMTLLTLLAVTRFLRGDGAPGALAVAADDDGVPVAPGSGRLLAE